MRNVLVFTVMGVMLIASSALAVKTTPQYTITDLGTFSGGNGNGSVYYINDFGQTAGCFPNGLFEPITDMAMAQAFTHSEWAGIVDIPDIYGFGDVPYGINNFGQATGIVYDGQSDGWGNPGMHAFLYDRTTGTHDLGVLPYSRTSWGLGINDFGQVVGVVLGYNGFYHAFFYSKKTGMLNIDGTPPAMFDDYDTAITSSAYGINDLGQVTGCYFNGIDGGGAFIYTVETGMNFIGPLGSCGNAINDFGEVTGSLSGNAFNDFGKITGVPGGHAFIYNKATGMKNIDTIPNSTESWGFGINNLGQVIGYYSTDNSVTTHTFLYIKGKMIDLNDLLPPSSGWTLIQGTGINDLGQIVGNGTINGQVHSFIMTPVR